MFVGVNLTYAVGTDRFRMMYDRSRIQSNIRSSSECLLKKNQQSNVVLTFIYRKTIIKTNGTYVITQLKNISKLKFNLNPSAPFFTAFTAFNGYSKKKSNFKSGGIPITRMPERVIPLRIN